MIKAMFFDVDGTLVSFRTHKATAAMADALEQLHRRGIKLFISTGRHPRMLQYLRDLFPFDGWVTMSGQFCYCGDQVIHRNPMDRQAVEELVSAAASNAFSCIFLEGHDIYINYANEQTHEFMKDLYLPLPPVQDPRRALDGELYQAITFLTKENEHLLLDRAPHLKTTRWHPTFLDVIPATGGKDKGSASDFVKSQADYTTGTVDEDGVISALRHFELL